jgi:Family of unknown function (DUF6515)
MLLGLSLVASLFLSCMIPTGLRHVPRMFPVFFKPLLVVGAFVTHLPHGHTVVVVGNTSYYYYEGTYYRPSSSGYVVVPNPAVNTAPTPEPAQSQVTSENTDTGAKSSSITNAPQTITIQPASDTTVVNIPNSRGGFTPVTLIKRGDRYIGPQGEFYTGHPTVAALKALYGD